MIIKISLVVLLICFASIALNPRVDVKWFAKAVMCFGIMNIIGMLASEAYRDESQSGLFAVIAFLFAYGTCIIHKRGTYK